MAQGNLGYKTSTMGKFAINSILDDLKRPQHKRGSTIDTSSTKEPYLVLSYLITMIIGSRILLGAENQVFDADLSQYLRLLRRDGWPERKINSMVLAVMKKVNLGVEVYRCMGGKFLR